MGSTSSLGFLFHANTALSVTSLGYFDAGQGLTESHDVGIYNMSGTLLGSTTVTNADTLVANFRYHTLGTAINLAAGTDYVIAGVSGTVDPYTYNPVSFSTSPWITFINNKWEYGNTLTFPTNSQPIAGTGFFGPNFQAVPEPASLALAGVAGLCGLISLAYRRRAQAA